MNFQKPMNKSKKFQQKSLPIANLSKFRLRNLNREIKRQISLLLKKKKVHNKTGEKCVFKDGLGLDKPQFMIQKSHLIKSQARLLNMAKRVFQSLKTD
jgi:hypothetical protein